MVWYKPLRLATIPISEDFVYLPPMLFFHAGTAQLFDFPPQFA